ncbi:MAG: protease inhibitor I42 family protein [Thermoleophilia bacterium]|jgi:predicted secreted protein|nr:protease inhibitor I42 family protein [Thermoleophilia bacterium]MBJ7334383.1 protease inhibitor I42 family protein [Thermoleophilia bacterium]
MNTRLRILAAGALVLVAAGLIAACGGSSSTTTATATVTETATATETVTATAEATTSASTTADGNTIYTEDNTTIDVATGDSVTIQLPINPSTGYTWVPYFPLEYMQLSDEILETESDGAVGVGTHEQWVIAINTPGPAEIVFDYFPPGNGVKSERSVTFTVNAS